MKTPTQALKDWQECRAIWRKVSDSISMLEHALSGKPMPEGFEELFRGFGSKPK